MNNVLSRAIEKGASSIEELEQETGVDDKTLDWRLRH
jgi:hypothetical protein